ncbi:MAG TPA: peptidoglycan binding domain-containing protein [Anaerolineae bacterium]|nr:peptidoglycan binding domain-containing protein [Anaerolineae bacterium]HQK15666.1 peptidoglycan binding domain-containing protein [Anaerolineae bacterium]
MTPYTNRPIASPRQSSGAFTGGLILALLLILLMLTLFCGWIFVQRMERLYEGHIYPYVYALGVPLGGMTPVQAAAALDEVASQVNTGMLILTDGDKRWTFAWSQAGLHLDTQAMAEEAYRVGRSGGFEGQLSVWLKDHEVPPRFAYDAEAGLAVLSQVAQEASLPPTEAGIELRNGQVIVVPGKPGRVVNVTQTLMALTQASSGLYRVEVPLVFDVVQPVEPDTTAVVAQAETLLTRTITLTAYEVLTDKNLVWTLGRETIAKWLRLVPGPDGKPVVDVNLYAIRDTLVALAEGLGDGRGFRYDEAAQQILEVFDAGGGTVAVYLTHPQRVYSVQSGDTLTSIGAKFGMPSGLIAEANPGIDYDHLSVGQQIIIPSQDVLTPYMPVPGKRIVVSLAEQRVRVYENGALLYDWPTSTGIASSPTHRGVFQILSKHEKAYASQWDLWMPYFLAVYPAGGGVENGFHELPILANGQRLWAGSLGRPASFGCIILGIPEAETLYNWAEVGVVVVIE